VVGPWPYRETYLPVEVVDSCFPGWVHTPLLSPVSCPPHAAAIVLRQKLRQHRCGSPILGARSKKNSSNAARRRMTVAMTICCCTHPGKLRTTFLPQDGWASRAPVPLLCRCCQMSEVIFHPSPALQQVSQCCGVCGHGRPGAPRSNYTLKGGHRRPNAPSVHRHP
jgi:hypothetical protein